MMKSFLDNPFNPVMFASYNQSVPKLAELDSSNPKVQRTFHLDVVYPKFKVRKPNLLCMGARATQKSTLLNIMLSSDFEVIHEGSKSQNACLFHDSIDAIFDSKDFPIGFNVFDLQGYACEDFFLIEKLLKNMPDVFIMVFVRTHDWFKKLAEFWKDDPETKDLFVKKLLVVAQYIGDQGKREKIRCENIMKKEFGGHLLSD